MPANKEILDVGGREVAISNPGKIFFPGTGHTKLDLVHYYLAVAEGALRGVRARPMALKRYVNGAEGDFFFQKRAPKSRPEWIDTVELSFPSGRTAEEVVVGDAAQLAWVINLGCIDLNPHPVRAQDLETPMNYALISTPCGEFRGHRSGRSPWQPEGRWRTSD
jgi:bifunctional non-homologous end joining protein LigD